MNPSWRSVGVERIEDHKQPQRGLKVILVVDRKLEEFLPIGQQRLDLQQRVFWYAEERLHSRPQRIDELRDALIERLQILGGLALAEIQPLRHEFVDGR